MPEILTPDEIAERYARSPLDEVPYLPLALSLTASLLGALATAGDARPTNREEVKTFRTDLEHEMRLSFAPTKRGVRADARLVLGGEKQPWRVYTIRSTMRAAELAAENAAAPDLTDRTYLAPFAVYVAELYAGPDAAERQRPLEPTSRTGHLIPQVTEPSALAVLAFARERFAGELPDYEGLVEACYDAHLRLFDGDAIDPRLVPRLNGELS